MEELITVDAVLALSDEQFEEVVLSQLSPDQRQSRVWDLIRSPAVLPRVRRVIVVLHQRTASVLADKSMEMNILKGQCEKMGAAGDALWREERPEYLRSFNASARFQRKLEDMQVELGPEPYSTTSATSVRRPLQALQALVAQVIAHEGEMNEDPSDADEDLWKILDSAEVVMGNRRLTLRQAYIVGWK